MSNSVRTRSVALGLSALAVTAVPNLGPLIRGTGEQTDRYDTSITPPGYAFTVWAPIFASILANAAQANVPSRRALPDNRVSAWPLSAAYTLNTLWSVAAQSGRFAYTAALLPAAVAASAVAYRRLQHLDASDSITSVSTGLLLGWTSLAASVNLSAATQLLGARRDSRASIGLSATGAGITAAALAVAAARSRRGAIPLAAASTWGLATTALDQRRPVISRLVAGVGAIGIASAAGLSAIRFHSPSAPGPLHR